MVQLGIVPRRHVFVSLLVGVASLACNRAAPTSAAALQPPVESTAVGAGDVLFVDVVGETELPKEYQVAADGTVQFPYVENMVVAGLEPQQIAAKYRTALVDAQILSAPQVVVRVKEYRSQKVVVLGQVKSPGSFPFQSGLTLIQAVSQAGGLNAIANATRVRLTRLLPNGATRSVDVDLEAISAGLAPDVPLQSGDRIYVVERVF